MDNNFNLYQNKQFYKSIYNICLDSIYLSFGIVIGLLLYSILKDTIFKYTNNNIYIKYIVLFGFIIGYIFMLNYLKKKSI